MPKCKNNSSRYYKGTEPSPKGKGWCASTEKVGKKRKGRDDQMWQVKKAGKSQRWVKCSPKPKKKKIKSAPKVHMDKDDTIVFNIVFRWWDPTEEDEEKIKRPSDEFLCRFIKSTWTKTFLDHYSQMVGVWIETKDPIEVYDKVVDMKHAKITSCFMEQNFMYTTWKATLQPYHDANDTRKIQYVTNSKMKHYLRCLKDVFNFTIRAGGFLSKKYSKKEQGEIEVVRIAPRAS